MSDQELLEETSGEDYIEKRSDGSWLDDLPDDDVEAQIDEYDITAAPNDFNVSTIFSFIESGAVQIPDFQRNYVWDIKRASKLIESIIIGLPIPQVFLYEESRNKFLVIDGQQRLMSIYYFIKQRFPKKERRVELRHIFDEHGTIPPEVLADDKYFVKFNLQLPEKLANQPNRFKGKNYGTLEDYKTQFDLRTIRNIIVKQNSPNDDDSSMYELFNRLNSGGVNLRPQEIRTSLYHSKFYSMLYRINHNDKWRKLIGLEVPDLHVKDIEILLRGFAMAVDGAQYAPSMTKFLNRFSKRSRSFTVEQNAIFERQFEAFVDVISALGGHPLRNPRTKKFSVALFEAAFAVLTRNGVRAGTSDVSACQVEGLRLLAKDEAFVEASQKDTTSASNVKIRLDLAEKYLCTQP